MINVDTVYQRVLAILNKEQRGYLTPQKFNLFANQVQLDILEQYFYDLETFLNIPGNDTRHADHVDTLKKKIGIFETEIVPTYSNAYFQQPDNLFRLSTVVHNGIECELVSKKDYKYIVRSPIAKPSDERPIYTISSLGIAVYGDSAFTDLLPTASPVLLEYIRKPNTVNWAYTNVLGVPQYNANNSTNFEIEASEEPDLIIKILELAGVEVKAADVINYAVSEEQSDEQQEIR